MAPNILLVVLDAVQANNCSLYGHGNETTPVLSELAETATVYTQARSPSFWSLPSHASIFSGFEVAEHGITGFEDRLARGNSVFETLNEDGYDTGVFSQNPHITQPDFGLDAGFETVVADPIDRPFAVQDAASPSEADLADYDGPKKYAAYLRHALAHDRPVGSLWNGALDFAETLLPSTYATRLAPRADADDYADAFLEWQRGREKWAACLNFMDAHQPMRPADEHNRWSDDRLQALHDGMDDIGWDFYTGRPWWQREALESLYQGCIRQMDATLGRIVRELRRRDVFDETLLVVTSDHGDGFGEWSRVRPGFRICDHNGGLHEVLTHVPLVVKAPNQTDGKTVSEPATLTRFPTAVDNALEGGDGDTVFVPDRPVVATADHDALYGDDRQRMTRYDETIDVSQFDGLARAVYEQVDGEVRKYVEWGSDTATVAVTDANEAMRIPSEVDVADRIETVFSQFDAVDGLAEGGELSARSAERLQNLGYLG